MTLLPDLYVIKSGRMIKFSPKAISYESFDLGGASLTLILSKIVEYIVSE